MDGVTAPDAASHSELMRWLDTQADDAARRKEAESDPYARGFHEGAMRAYRSVQARTEFARLATATTPEELRRLVEEKDALDYRGGA